MLKHGRYVIQTPHTPLAETLQRGNRGDLLVGGGGGATLLFSRLLLWDLAGIFKTESLLTEPFYRCRPFIFFVGFRSGR